MAAPDPGNAPVRVPRALLDLPDDMLRRILLNLDDETELRTVALAKGPNAWALAMTCRRLYRIFRSTLHTVDALFPASYGRRPVGLPNQLFGSCWGQPKQLLGTHLATIVRMAGEDLHALHLPPDLTDIQAVVHGVKDYCPNLRALSFSNDADVPESVERDLFASAPALTTLHISDPRTIFDRMSDALHLEDLTLTGVRPVHISCLTQTLQAHGRRLRILKLGFNATSYQPEHRLSSTAARECMTRFAEQMCDHLPRDLPLLKTLDVSSSPPHCMVHDLFDGDTFLMFLGEMVGWDLANPFAKVMHIATRVTAARERRAGEARGWGLRNLAVRSAYGSANQCVSLFERFISAFVDVEVQFPGARVAFPVANEAVALRLKSLQVTTSMLQVAVELWSHEFATLEMLDLGTPNMVSLYARDFMVQDKVGSIIRMAGTRLKHVCLSFPIRSNALALDTFLNVTNILRAAPSVSRLEISRGVVAYFAGFQSVRESFIAEMRNIGVLLLRGDTAHDDARLGSRRSMVSIFLENMVFVQGLPMFLEMVACSCPSLECISLDLGFPGGYQDETGSRDMTMALGSALEAVEKFEKKRPRVDLGSVRAQLNIWSVEHAPRRGRVVNCSCA